MPKRTVIAPKQPARYTRVTAEGKDETVNLTFAYHYKNRKDPIVKNFNNVRGLVHRANGSYGIINVHGVKVDEVYASWDLVLVNLNKEEVAAWGR